VEVFGVPRPELALSVVYHPPKSVPQQRTLVPLLGRDGDRVLTVVALTVDPPLPTHGLPVGFRGIVEPRFGGSIVWDKTTFARWDREFRQQRFLYIDTLAPRPSTQIAGADFVVAATLAALSLIALLLAMARRVAKQEGEWTAEVATAGGLRGLLILGGFVAVILAGLAWARANGMTDRECYGLMLCVVLYSTVLLVPGFCEVMAVSRAGLLLQGGFTGRVRRIEWSEIAAVRAGPRLPWRRLRIDLVRGRSRAPLDPRGELLLAAGTRRTAWALAASEKQLDGGATLDFDSVQLTADRLFVLGSEVRRGQLVSAGRGTDALRFGIVGEKFPRQVATQGVADAELLLTLLGRRWLVSAPEVESGPAPVDRRLSLIGAAAILCAAEFVVHGGVRGPGLTRVMLGFGGGLVVGLVGWMARTSMPREPRQKAALFDFTMLGGAVLQIAAALAYGGAAGVAAIFEVPSARRFTAAPVVAVVVVVVVVWVATLLLPGAAVAVGVSALWDSAAFCPGCGRRWKSSRLRNWLVPTVDPRAPLHRSATRNAVIGRVLAGARAGAVEQALVREEQDGAVRRRVALGRIHRVHPKRLWVDQQQCPSCGAAAIRFTVWDQAQRCSVELAAQSIA
jgi:hypothetical protein